MRKYLLFFIVVLSLFASCATKKVTVADNSTRDGSSYKKAIVINESYESPGVKAEYAWIRANYPNSQNNGQAMTYYEKKPYDILHITTADGKAISVYFDISKFYGKF